MTKRNFAVIGLGTFGLSLARTLAGFGDHVLGIDRDDAAAATAADRLARVVIADCREARAVEEAGLGSYDLAIVAVASDVEASVLTVMNLKQAGVAEVWAKSSGETHTRILERLGVDRVLQPEESFGELLAQVAHNPSMRGSVRLTGDMHLAQIETPASLCGKTLGTAKLAERHDLLCLGVVRAAVVLAAAPEVEICEGDGLIVAGTRPTMRRFADRA